MIDRSAATTQWLVAAIFAKVCGATDPAAVVEQAAREWEDSSKQWTGQGRGYWDAHWNPFDWVPAHIRRIQELAESES